MNINFRGWKREVFEHNHELMPVVSKGTRNHSGNKGDPIEWFSATKARGRVNGLNLTGDFQVDFEFKDSELKNWLLKYVSEEPEAACRLIAEIQGEVAIFLSRKAKKDAIEEINSETK